MSKDNVAVARAPGRPSRKTKGAQTLGRILGGFTKPARACASHSSKGTAAARVIVHPQAPLRLLFTGPELCKLSEGAGRITPG
jgi:hypothetical protein